MFIIDGREADEQENVDLSWRGIVECYAESDVIVDFNLSYNHLTSFVFTFPPDGRGGLPNLQRLHLCGNRLTSFPRITRNDFPNLRYLNLSSNRLTSFVVEAGGFRNLQELDLAHNKLTSFEIEPESFPILQELDLYDNELTSFVVRDLELLYLYKLDVFGNRLTSFVVGDSGLPSLESLELSENQLTSFEIGTGDLAGLVSLYLLGNRLTFFGASAAAEGGLPNLRTISLSNNPELSALNLVRGQVPKLSSLDMVDTTIRFVDPSLEEFAVGEIKARAHVFGLREMLVTTFEIDSHPVLEEMREHIEV